MNSLKINVRHVSYNRKQNFFNRKRNTPRLLGVDETMYVALCYLKLPPFILMSIFSKHVQLDHLRVICTIQFKFKHFSVKDAVSCAQL